MMLFVPVNVEVRWLLVNSKVTTFVKLEKLKLGETKCARLHIGGKGVQNCPPIFVNIKPINESEKEKYL